jgi:hypothetical protein
MKKFWLYLTISFLCLQTSVYAQCTPDLTITQPGIYPDSLPPAIVGVPYSQELQVRVLTDTIINGQNATINSIEIISITGAPAGFTYVCNPGTCIFPGGGNGCLVFSGTATQAGTYPLVITIEITATIILFGVPATITQTETLNDYTFKVVDPASVSIVNRKSLEVFQNFPNPVLTKTSVDFTVLKATSAEFKIFNVLGKEVLDKKINARAGKNTIDLDLINFEDGIYMYSIKTGNTVMTRRMVISRKQ